MKTPIRPPIPGMLAAVAVLVLLAALPCCEGCGEKPGDGRTEARKAPPAAKPPRPDKPRRLGKISGTTDAELPTITVKTVSGGVALVPRTGEPERPAQEGDEIAGGGWIEVRTGGSATVAVREVGNFSLAPGALLSVPARLACGAVLLDGAALSAGAARIKAEKSCYLHTPAGALQYPRAKIVVAVASGGRTRVAAIEGSAQVSLPDGEPIELATGTQLTLDPRAGAVGEPEPFVRGDGPVERAFDDWRAKQPAAGGAATRQALEVLDGLVKRLEADTGRFTELLAANRESKSKRRQASFDRADASPGRIEDLDRELATQSEELNSLRDRITLIAGRFAALVALARRGPASGERVEELQAAFEKLAAGVPSVFERRRKPAVEIRGLSRPRPELPMQNE